MKALTCADCSEIFFGHGNCLRCSNCRPEYQRLTYIANRRKYYLTPYGFSQIKRRNALHDKTEKGRTARAQRQSRYRQGTGKLKQKIWEKTYLYSPKGQAQKIKSNARNSARRREAPGNPNNVADLSFEIHTIGRPCVKCGLPAQEVDHIFPIALGGSHDLENLQPLCRECHRIKTTDDLRFISLLKVK